MRSVTLGPCALPSTCRALPPRTVTPRPHRRRAARAHRCFAASAPHARTTRTRTARVTCPAAAPPHRRPRCTAAAAAAMRQPTRRAEHDGRAGRPAFRPVSRLGKGLDTVTTHSASSPVTHHPPGVGTGRHTALGCRGSERPSAAAMRQITPRAPARRAAKGRL